MKIIRFLPVAAVLILVGCGNDNFDDLDQFMQQAREKPGGQIEPLPAFVPYRSFVYSAAGLRSPFDPPNLVNVQQASGQETEAPDMTRPKEYLERFNFAALRLVGTVKDKDSVMWALINDGTGAVHRAKFGNYLGKNYGRIVEVTQNRVEIIETVTDGQGGWIERPRTLNLN